MTAQELMDLATKSAHDQIDVNTKMLNAHIDASERIFARGVSQALSDVAVELLKNPTN